MSSQRKIAIIGGGIAGLCAGVYARRSGYDVDVFEQHESAGGLATSWRRDVYTFETCLSWLLGSKPGGWLHSQWQEVFDIDKVSFVNPAELMRIENSRGERLSIYADADRLEAELLKVSPQDAAEIHHLADAVRKFAVFPMPDPTERSLRNFMTMLRAAPALPLLRQWASISGEEYSRRFSNPLIRNFFGGGDSSRLAALTTVFMLAWAHAGNAGYPVGGSQAVIRPIVERLRDLGGRLRLGAAVKEILVRDDAAAGVSLSSGETVAADWVISAADGHATIYDMLGGRYTDEAIDTTYRTLQTYSSYLQVSLGVARDLSQEAGTLVRLLDVPLAVDPGTEVSRVLFRIFYFDPSFAPPGKTAVTCFLPTRNFDYWLDLQRRDPEQYQAEKRRVAAAVTDVFERCVPGVRQAIEVTDVSTPATIVHYTRNWKGSMEGWMPTPGIEFGLLHQTLPRLGRFMMVGQWVMPGGGLPSGLMTARAAMQQVCKEDRVPFLASTASEPVSLR